MNCVSERPEDPRSPYHCEICFFPIYKHEDGFSRTEPGHYNRQTGYIDWGAMGYFCKVHKDFMLRSNNRQCYYCGKYFKMGWWFGLKGGITRELDERGHQCGWWACRGCLASKPPRSEWHGWEAAA